VICSVRQNKYLALENVMTLLYVSTSIRPDGSTSRDLAETFLESWRQTHPHDTVVHRDLGAAPLPHLSLVEVTASMTDPRELTPEQAQAQELGRELAAEFVDTDAYLIATPMYNWSIPSALKAWLDRLLLQPNVWQTEKVAAGRPAVILMAKGGAYGPGTPRADWDYAEPYLRRIFGEVLGLDATFISAELTLAGVSPALAGLEDERDESARKAHEAAAEHARRLAALRAA